MSEPYCPNYASCKLVKANKLEIGDNVRQLYLEKYCSTNSDAWKSCKRFQCKEAIHFCPDFVLPDTKLSIDEIIDQFDSN